MARIITKGLIGLEDLSIGTSTFTRSTSTGGSIVLHQLLVGSSGKFEGIRFADQFPGADVGAQINAAITDIGTKGVVYVPAGTYSFSTTIQYANGITIQGAGPYGTVLNYTGTGTAVNMGNVTGGVWRDLSLNLNSATATGIKCFGTQNWIENFQISGPALNCIWITGDGVSSQSPTVFVTNGKIEAFNLAGIRVDHALDVFLTALSIYSTPQSTTSQPLIIDTGVSGLYASQVATGWGLHGVTVQSTNSGGSYGSAPIFLWFDQVLADGTTGGDAWLFASSLSTSTVSAHLTNCWASFAGYNSSNTIITAASNGIHISGGKGYYIGAGTRIRVCTGNGILIDSTNVADVTIESCHIFANNQDNSATQHGIFISVVASNIGIVNCFIGNIVDTGGFQRYGVNAAANPTGLRLIGNDLSSNVTGGFNPPSSAVYTSWANLPTTVTGQVLGTNYFQGPILVNGAAAVATAGLVSFGSTVASTVGAAGAATALPAQPLGYLIANVAGTQVKIPYYNN